MLAGILPLMLNCAAYKLMADLPTVALRLFLRLIVNQDLTAYRAFSVPRVCELYGLDRAEVYTAMSALVAIGLLEEGPKGKRPRFKTYRIRPGYLLGPDDLREFFRETAERRERETMTP